MSAEKASEKYGSKSSGILYIVTALVVTVFIIFGLVISVVFMTSTNNLIDKSKDKIIQTEVDNITTTMGYITDLLMPVFNQKGQEITMAEMLDALTTGKLTSPQLWMIDEMQKEVDSGVMNLEVVLAVMTDSPLTGSRPVILASNDQSLIKWDIPDYLLDALEGYQGYLLLEQGVPELGLTGEQLMIFKETDDPQRGVTAYFIGFTSLQDTVDEIDSFYNSERSKTIVYISVVMAISIAVIVLITFFVLSRLLRKRITEPINELSAAAGEVMEGNLEVEVPVRKGEDLEKLKTVFNEMIYSIREVINKSMGMDKEE